MAIETIQQILQRTRLDGSTTAPTSAPAPDPYSSRPSIPKRRGSAADAIRRIYEEEGADPELGLAMGKQEGGNWDTRTSGAGAQGPLQVIPKTGLSYVTPEEWATPEGQIRASARYTKHLAKQFNNDPYYIVGAYHAGEGKVRQYFERGETLPRSPEFYDKHANIYTPDHVDRVLRNLQNGQGKRPRVTSGASIRDVLERTPPKPGDPYSDVRARELRQVAEEELKSPDEFARARGFNKVMQAEQLEQEHGLPPQQPKPAATPYDRVQQIAASGAPLTEQMRELIARSGVPGAQVLEDVQRLNQSPTQRPEESLQRPAGPRTLLTPRPEDSALTAAGRAGLAGLVSGGQRVLKMGANLAELAASASNPLAPAAGEALRAKLEEGERKLAGDVAAQEQAYGMPETVLRRGTEMATASAPALALTAAGVPAPLAFGGQAATENYDRGAERAITEGAKAYLTVGMMGKAAGAISPLRDDIVRSVAQRLVAGGVVGSGAAGMEIADQITSADGKIDARRAAEVGIPTGIITALLPGGAPRPAAMPEPPATALARPSVPRPGAPRGWDTEGQLIQDGLPPAPGTRNPYEPPVEPAAPRPPAGPPRQLSPAPEGTQPSAPPVEVPSNAHFVGDQTAFRGHDVQITDSDPMVVRFRDLQTGQPGYAPRAIFERETGRPVAVQERAPRVETPSATEMPGGALEVPQVQPAAPVSEPAAPPATVTPFRRPVAPSQPMRPNVRTGVGALPPNRRQQLQEEPLGQTTTLAPAPDRIAEEEAAQQPEVKEPQSLRLLVYNGSTASNGELQPRGVPQTYNQLGSWFTSEKAAADELYSKQGEKDLPVRAYELPKGKLLEADTEDFNRFFASDLDLVRQYAGEKAAKVLREQPPDGARLRELGDKLNRGVLLPGGENRELKRLEESNRVSRALLNNSAYMAAFQQKLKAQGYQGIVWRKSRIDGPRTIPQHDVFVVFHDQPIRPVDSKSAPTNQFLQSSAAGETPPRAVTGEAAPAIPAVETPQPVNPQSAKESDLLAGGWTKVDANRYIAKGHELVREGGKWTLKGGDRPKAFGSLKDAIPAAVEATKVADLPALVANHLRDKSFATIVEARKFAEAATGRKVKPGTPEAKRVDEAVEAGIVRRAREIVQAGGQPADTYRQLVELYQRQPNLGVRTSTSVRDQAYSTPVPLAYLASQLAGINKDSQVYEPSAGNGALLIGANPKLVLANEINPERRGELANQGFTTRDLDATGPVAASKAFDVVIANPPFGRVKDGNNKSRVFQLSNQYSTAEIDHAIVLKSLSAMKDDGRAVLIVGGVQSADPKARSDAYNSKAKRQFYFTLYNAYNVTDHFTVDGDLYARQGAGWPVDVIVINGRGKSARKLPAVDVPRIYHDWNQLAELVNRTEATPSNVLGAQSQPKAVGDQDRTGATTRPGDLLQPAERPAGGTAQADGRSIADILADTTPSGQPPARRPAQRPARSGKPDNIQQPGSAGTAGRTESNPAGQAQSAQQRPAGGTRVQGDDAGTVGGRADGGAGQENVEDIFNDVFDELFTQPDARSIDDILAETPPAKPDITLYQLLSQIQSTLLEIKRYRTEIETGKSYVDGKPLESWQKTERRNRLQVDREHLRTVYSAHPDWQDAIQERVARESGQIEVDIMRGSAPLDATNNSNKADRPAPKAARPRTPKVAPRPATASTPQQQLKPITMDDIAKGLRDILSGDVPDVQFAALAPEFDQRKYAALRTYFDASMQNAATDDVRAAMKQLLSTLNKQYQFTPEMIQQLRPYIVRFVQDWQTKGDTAPEPSPTEADQPAQHQPFEPGEIKEGQTQVKYRPVSTARSVNTLVPVNQATATANALRGLAERVGSLDVFVAKKLGFSQNHVAQVFSAEQVDALALSIENIERGAGFIIGDQTGIGKGRIVAGIIRYALETGRTPIFVTEKPPLYGDMIRDLTDIGLPDVRPLITNSGEAVPLDDEALAWFEDAEMAKARKERIPPRRGKFLETKGAESHNAMLKRMANRGKLEDYDVIFTTYSQMQTVSGGNRTVRHDLLETFAQGGVVIFDESHNAGGGKPKIDKQGEAQLDRAQFARQIARKADAVFYSSATFAKRPEVMDLYFKTDLAKAVADPEDLPIVINAGGVPLQQAVSAMLTEAGQYMRRERSFDGIEYGTQAVKVNRTHAENVSKGMELVNEFSKTKSRAVEEMDAEIKGAASSILHDGSTGQAGAESLNFTSIMHNIVNQMLLSLKADAAADLAIEALKRGEKPVLTVANTMGSFIQQFVEDNGINPGDAVDLNFGDLLMRYLDRSREVIIGDAFGKKEKKRLTDDELGPVAVAAYNKAVKFIKDAEMGDMPISPIDWMHHRLRQAGYKTGEITGRNHTLDYSGVGGAKYKVRPGSEVSTAGKKRAINGFNSGAIDALILNQSGSTGISLHASEKFADQRRRVMILVQAEANIDTHMQMLGRINRTGQIAKDGKAPKGKPAVYGLPRYMQMAADIPAETRPAAVLAKKMASLNANTTAARGSAVTAKDVVDFINEYGDEVAAQVMMDRPDINRRLGNPVSFDEEGKLVKGEHMRKVTGRLPLLSIKEQEEIYDILTSEYLDEIAQREAMGQNTLEAKTLPLAAETTKKEIIVKGDEAGSPFTRSAYAETMMVKRLGKPMTSAQVLDALREETGAPEDADLAAIRALGRGHWKELQSETQDKFKAFKERQLSEFDGVIAALEKLLAGTDLDPEVRDAKETELNKTKRQRETQENRLNGIFLRWSHLGGLAKLGQPVKLQMGDDTMYGIVSKLERKGQSENPVALGQWRITFAVADAARKLTIPMSKLAAEGDDSGGNKTVVTEATEATIFDYEKGGAQKMPVLDAFDAGQSASREQRTMLTGNMLSAFAKFPKGQIVNFTDDNGDVRQGILMPKSFNLKKEMDDQPVLLKTSEHALQYLDQAYRAEIRTPDDGLLIKFERGRYVFAAASAKGTGGKYYLNQKLTSIAGADFVKSGSKMQVGVDRQQAKQMLDALLGGQVGGKPVPLQAVNAKEQARKITGESVAPPEVQFQFDPQNPDIAMQNAPRGWERADAGDHEMSDLTPADWKTASKQITKESDPSEIFGAVRSFYRPADARISKGVVVGNKAASIALMHAYEVMSGGQVAIAPAGMTLKRKDAHDFADFLKHVANMGVTGADNLRQLARDFERAAAASMTVFYVDADPSRTKENVERTVQHEVEIHGWQAEISQENPGLVSAEWMKADPDYHQIVRSLRRTGYPAPEKKAPVEAIAYILSGEADRVGYTGPRGEERALDFAHRYLMEVARQHGVWTVKRLRARMPASLQERLNNEQVNERDGAPIPQQRLVENNRAVRGTGGRPTATGTELQGRDGSLGGRVSERGRAGGETSLARPLGNGESAEIIPINSLDVEFASLRDVFGVDDIKGTLAEIREWSRESLSDIRSVVNPMGRGSSAQETASIVRDRAAELARKTDQAEAKFRAGRKLLMKLDWPQRRAFMYAIETAAVHQLPSELQPIANLIRQTLDEHRQEVQNLGTGKLQSYYQDYFPHIWKDPKKAQQVFHEYFGKRPFQGSKSFLKQRTVPTIEHGIAMGLEPVSQDPVELVMLKLREMDRYVMAHLIMQEMRDKGLLVRIKATHRVPDGYGKIDDSVGTIFGAPVNGALTIRGYWIGPEPAVNVINNYLSPGLRKFAPFRGYLAIANVMNQFQLGFSAFHLGFTSLDAAISKMALAQRQLRYGRPLAAARSVMTVPIAPITNLLQGRKVYKAWETPGSSGPEWDEIANAMQAGGGRARMDSFYATQITKKMKEAFAKKNLPGAVEGLFRVPFAIVEQASRPIMEYIVPRQKMGVFADLARLELDKLGPNASHEDVRRVMAKIWDSVDNRMGQLVYDNLFWHKTFKDLMMGSVRSVGWNLGTKREGGGGALDTAKFATNIGARIVRSGAGLIGGGGRIPPAPPRRPGGTDAWFEGNPEFTYRMDYIIAMTLVVGTFGALLNYLFTGEGPRELKDYFFPRTGNTDENGRPERLSLPAYVKDIYHYAHDPKRTALNKLHPALNLLGEIWSNQDFYGTEIWNEDDPPSEKTKGVLRHVAKSFEPFAYRGMLEEHQRGSDWKRSVLPFVGLTPAPSSINKTPAENLMDELARERRPIGTRTKQEAASAKLRRDLTRGLRRGQDQTAALNQAVQAGQISPNQARETYRRAATPPLVYQFNHLGLADSLKVWEVATVGERELLRPLLRQKAQNAMRNQPHELIEPMLPKLREILGSP